MPVPLWPTPPEDFTSAELSLQFHNYYYTIIQFAAENLARKLSAIYVSGLTMKSVRPRPPMSHVTPRKRQMPTILRDPQRAPENSRQRKGESLNTIGS